MTSNLEEDVVDTDMASSSDNKQRSRVVNWDSKMVSNMMDNTTKGISFYSSNHPKAENVDLSTLMAHENYSIVVGIQISNWTKYSLIDPYISPQYGYIPTPTSYVLPGSTEALIARKHGYTMTGSSGVASWLIEGTKRRLFILWDTPFFTSNKLAVGFTHEGTNKFKDEWYAEIVDQKLHEKLIYKIAIHKKICEEILAEDEQNKFQVSGIMGSGGKPKISVVFRPTNEEDLFIKY